MSSKSYSNSITLVRVADGESANSYYIETNYNEILRFNTSNGLQFSPSTVTFQVSDLSKNEEQSISDFDWSISFLNTEGEYSELASKDSNPYENYINYSPSIEIETETQAIQEEGYNTLYLDFWSLFNFLESKEPSSTDEERIIEEEFVNMVKKLSSSLVLKFSYVNSGYTRAEKIIVVKNGVSSDMAKLNINAADIVASIQNASLKFSSNGLELKNGDFKIYKEVTEAGETKRESVLYTENDNLIVKGTIYATDGEFTGIVHATDGDFSGTIKANGGSIGGFEIISDEEQSYLKSINGNIKLDGTNGNIIAESIELGRGATISDYIAFPYTTKEEEEQTAYIYNPSVHESLWLSADQTKLYTNGLLQLGTIELYGGTGNLDGYIRSVQTNLDNQVQDGYWQINEDGSSYFQNIYANEVHLQDSILEIGSIQNVGSLMMFKDAWNVIKYRLITNSVEFNGETHESIESNETEEISETTSLIEVELDGYNSLTAGDWIFSNDKIYKVVDSKNPIYYIIVNGNYQIATNYQENEVYYERDEETENYVEVSINGIYSIIKIEGEGFTGKVVTKFGKEEDDYIFSIFGETDEQKTYSINRDFATPNSLTISSFSVNNGIPKYTKNLILGKLSDSTIDDLKGVTGFGLYADNVYLKGSLTTKISSDQSQLYAGINTKSNVNFNLENNPTKDNSFIVFWGGAKSQDEADIQKAPFQVTANGTLYASEAIIQNSVVAGANIYGSKIYTAEIHGWDNDENKTSALSIYDSSKGIVFKTESEIILFSIQGNGFQQIQNDESKYFITLDSVKPPLFTGDFETEPGDDNNYIQISGNGLNFCNNGKALLEITSHIDNSNNNEAYMDFSITESVFELRKTKIEAKTDVYINENMEMGSRTMTYKKVDGGYDLYVY